MFQVITLSFKNPKTGEEKKGHHFLGLAAFSKEEFEEIRKASLGEVLTGIVIGEPEDPLKYAKEHPEIKDLMDGVASLQQEYEEKKGE